MSTMIQGPEVSATPSEAPRPPEGGWKALLASVRTRIDSAVRRRFGAPKNPFEGMSIDDVLKKIRDGESFEPPANFQPVPPEMKEDPVAFAIAEATRYGAWLVENFLCAKGTVAVEKSFAGDLSSKLDMAADLAAVAELRRIFKGRIATRTIVDKEGKKYWEADETPEEIRARDLKPVFIFAEESSPEISSLDDFVVGDEILLVDGLDGSSAVRFRKPGGAPVMVGRGVIVADGEGGKRLELSDASVLFPKSGGINPARWFFATENGGAFLRSTTRGTEKLDVTKSRRPFEESHLRLNPYTDDRSGSVIMRRLLKRMNKVKGHWPKPAGVTTGLPSSEHALFVADLESGHHVAVSDNQRDPLKVGLWDFIVVCILRKAGCFVRTFANKDLKLLVDPPQPIIFAQNEAQVSGVIAMAAEEVPITTPSEGNASVSSPR